MSIGPVTTTHALLPSSSPALASTALPVTKIDFEKSTPPKASIRTTDDDPGRSPDITQAANLISSLIFPNTNVTQPSLYSYTQQPNISTSAPGPSLVDEMRESTSTTPTTSAQHTLEPSLHLPSTSTITVLKTQTAVIPAPLQPAAATLPEPSTSKTSTIWTAPARITDLSDFKIAAFPGGPRNLDIVQGIPAEASAAPFPSPSQSPGWSDFAAAEANGEDGEAVSAWDNSSSVLQLFYPENSINPGNKPLGGAQFYATPLDISDARSVALSYSVFFPVDFDWVRGGKLPGLYGGHTGCSGGDEALDCFSTRLMWRRKGEGELYLYAPKDEQTDELCSHPQSVCSAAYGFSVGRGSFKWTPGAWTNVRQTVTLNTPGEQDGSFALEVDGKRVIDRNDVYYRGEAMGADDRKRRRKNRKKRRPQGLGDLIGDLLGGLLVTTEGLSLQAPVANVTNGTSPAVVELSTGDAAQRSFMLEMVPLRVEKVSDASKVDVEQVGEASPTSEFPSPPPVQAQLQQWDEKPVGFVGLFFSTFFGGHDPEWATPRDQYVWFKDFAISYNE